MTEHHEKAAAIVTDDFAAPYEVGDPIALSTLFEVRSGVDRRLGRPVHLRLLRDDWAGRSEVVEALTRAVAQASPLTHPNLVAIFDVGILEDRFCLVTEAPAACLAARGDYVDAAALRRLARNCADGLAAAHEAGLVHGDIHESTIFTAADGTAKLAEVGLYPAAAAAAPDLVGPHHAPPGEAMGPSVDVFALGTSLLGVMAAKGSVDGELARVLGRATDPSARRRFASAQAMLAALDAESTMPIPPVAEAPDEPPVASIEPVPEEVRRENPEAPSTRVRRRLPRVAGLTIVRFVAVVAAAAVLLAVALTDTDDAGQIPVKDDTAGERSDLPPEVRNP